MDTKFLCQQISLNYPEYFREGLKVFVLPRDSPKWLLHIIWIRRWKFRFIFIYSWKFDFYYFGKTIDNLSGGPAKRS